MSDRILVLLSGGLDSSVLLRYCQLERKQQTSALFLDWGQSAALREREAAEWVAKESGVQLLTVSIPQWRAGFRERVNMLDVPRNGILLMLALPYGRAEQCDEIALGSTTEDHQVLDSNEQFVDALNIFLGTLGQPQRLVAPYLKLNWSKVDIIHWADERLGAAFVDKTTSCWKEPACQVSGPSMCPACIKRMEAMRKARSKA